MPEYALVYMPQVRTLMKNRPLSRVTEVPLSNEAALAPPAENAFPCFLFGAAAPSSDSQGACRGWPGTPRQAAHRPHVRIGEPRCVKVSGCYRASANNHSLPVFEECNGSKVVTLRAEGTAWSWNRAV